MIISASQFWYAKVNQACLNKFVFPTYEINAKTALFSHRYCIKSPLHILIHHHIEIISRNSFRLTSISPSFANRLDLFFIHKSIRQIRTTWNKTAVVLTVLKVTDTVQLRFCYCLSLYANVQLVKHDIVTAIIYCYITTDFHYMKCDSRLSAYGGVMLQKVCIEKNVKRHFSLNFAKFCNKNNWPQCLVFFFIVILRFSGIRNLLSDLTLSECLLLRRVKATYSILKSLLLEAGKRHLKHASCPNSSIE